MRRTDVEDPAEADVDGRLCKPRSRNERSADEKVKVGAAALLDFDHDEELDMTEAPRDPEVECYRVW